jgi:hypothetical protein
MVDQLARVDGLGPAGEIRLVPDLSAALCSQRRRWTVDMRTLEGEP